MSFTTFDHDGLALNCWDDGGPGLPVVFQHGLCGAEPQVAEVLPPVSSRPEAGRSQGDFPAYRRLTLECRGHGRSEPGPLDRLSIATFADDLAAFIEERVGRPVILGGISMGAAIASRLAVTRPDLVRALVLARPAWVTASAPANMAPNALVGRLLAEHDPAEARRLFEASATASDLAAHAPDNLASLRGFFAREPLDVTSALLTRISADGPGITPSDLGTLSMPTLVIGHGQDAIHPMAHAADLALLIPQARLVEITPKAIDRGRYTAEFRSSLHGFIRAAN
ncbi:MAG TPA: alpha/beta hydrolase [Geminicoccus sp.]|jgi:pimeloyl-ACP methyl ester carboxylesterase|uniref:alpha/beta fold hydrolase n=1 Tax=Geminicoccus sp. TaxID=2024832 RepID=UPI002E31C883|nr:alpha/beta hydrolase [Geminicoccus sp.]HEX2525145.1 alpha/beta hydrolase [Geminicoccus sp.]